MNVINKDNYNFIIEDNNVYIKTTDNNNNNISIICANIIKSEHKVIVKYQNICHNNRPDVRYYSIINYIDYIKRRINEFFNKFHIIIENNNYKIVNN